MTPMPESSDLYKILQVDPEASPEIIQAAHRLLSEIHHPDRNPAADAGERLAEINRAYDEVLSDPQRREAYDRHRAGSLPDVIQAKSFRLVNDAWQTRAELSLDSDGDPMLVMNDRNGNRRFVIWQSEGGAPFLRMLDQQW